MQASIGWALLCAAFLSDTVSDSLQNGAGAAKSSLPIKRQLRGCLLNTAEKVR